MDTDPAAAPAPTGAAATTPVDEPLYTLDDLLRVYLWGREDERRRLAGDWAEIQHHWPELGEQERQHRIAQRLAEIVREPTDRPPYTGGPVPWE